VIAVAMGNIDRSQVLAARGDPVTALYVFAISASLVNVSCFHLWFINGSTAVAGAWPAPTNLLFRYPWLRFCSRLIHSRMYGAQLTSRTPFVSHLFRNRTTSTSTSVTSSICTAAFQLSCHFQKIFPSNSTDQPDGRATAVDSLFDLQGHVGAS
jgi:hypothetical protein